MPIGIYIRIKPVWNKGTKGICKPNFGSFQKGKQHPKWKGAFVKTRKHINKIRKAWRHRIGVSKRYKEDIIAQGFPRKYHAKVYKYRWQNAGKLSLKTIQLVYEDNIKKYGTLTCYLCINPITFGDDTLEHKTPLSRGGTNEYRNLGIACRKCNNKKINKTEAEYRRYILERFND